MEFFIFLFLFFIFFENLLLKIELSEITPFFYNNFFGFGGGEFPPFPPWLRPWIHLVYKAFLFCFVLFVKINFSRLIKLLIFNPKL